MGPVQRWAITVHGRVQGVGFRYFTAHAARRLELSGWVRNCSDGSVEMEVQGPPETLEVFRNEINEGPPVPARVAELKAAELPVARGEEGFDIRH